jgi:hypothetical protein
MPDEVDWSAADVSGTLGIEYQHTRRTDEVFPALLLIGKVTGMVSVCGIARAPWRG